MQKKREQQKEVLKTFMAAWLDHDKAIATLSKRPCRSGTKYTQDMFAGKVQTHYHEKRFKVAFNEVQRVIKDNWTLGTGAMQQKKGKGIRAVIAKVSKEYLDSLNNIKISRGAIERALQRGDEVSLLKAGRKVSVPHDPTCMLLPLTLL